MNDGAVVHTSMADRPGRNRTRYCHSRLGIDSNWEEKNREDDRADRSGSCSRESCHESLRWQPGEIASNGRAAANGSISPQLVEKNSTSQSLCGDSCHAMWTRT